MPPKMNPKEQAASNNVRRRSEKQRHDEGQTRFLVMSSVFIVDPAPETIWFNALTHFFLYDSQLTTLFQEVSRSAKLSKLELQDNQLTTLPPEIARFT